MLVSGGFAACLQPIANHLGVKHLLCTELQQIDGHYTGKIESEPTIGIGKVNRINKFIKEQTSINLKNCFAYGDHYSDLPMLLAVGNPCVASGAKQLEHYAAYHGWPILH